jgi:hypothetical protein
MAQASSRSSGEDPIRQTAQTCSYVLENIVRVNDSVYGWDKSVKIMAYAFGLASNYYAKTRGHDSNLAGKILTRISKALLHCNSLCEFRPENLYKCALLDSPLLLTVDHDFSRGSRHAASEQPSLDVEDVRSSSRWPLRTASRSGQSDTQQMASCNMPVAVAAHTNNPPLLRAMHGRHSMQ